MSSRSENNDTTEAELSAWRKLREKRKRERKKQQQQDEAGNEDELDALARNLDSEKNQNGDMGEMDEPSNNGSGDDAPFVPLAKRKRLETEVLIGGMAHRRRHIGMADVETRNGNTDGIDNGSEIDGEKNTDNDNSNPINDGDNEDKDADPKKIESLLESATALQEALTEEERAEKLRKEEESRIMKEASKVQTNALQAASELAKGIQYTNPMPSTWTCPRYILDQGEDAWEKIRKEWHMEVEGVDVPPPAKRFVDMKFAPPILEVLKRKGIKKPTPIQMQGLTVVRMVIEGWCILMLIRFSVHGCHILNVNNLFALPVFLICNNLVILSGTSRA